MTIFTIGHSSRPLSEFLDLLADSGVRSLVDIRSFPHSPRNPQYDVATLPLALEGAGIAYRHLPGLGGRRSRILDPSPNAGWREPAFRNYADYMQTDAFEQALGELLTIAVERPTAYMCAEAVPWRCHRQLVSDCLTARGHEVYHILGKAPPRRHALTRFAVKTGNCVQYPAYEEDSGSQKEFQK